MKQDEWSLNYNSVRISTLRGDQKIGFDLFVQLGERYVHYIRTGSSFEGERLQRLKDKKLKKLFIPIDQEDAYRRYVQTNIETAYDPKSGKAIEERAAVAQGMQQAAAESVMDDPASKESYDSAKDGSRRFADLILREDKSIGALLALENTDQNVAHHGVTVSTLALGIAKKIGIKDEKQTSMITLCGLLHDAAHFKNGLAINRPLADMSPDDLKIYKEHPKAGALLVNEQAHFDVEVVKVIMEHEELIDGSGFPGGLMQKALHPFSVIVGTANAFDRLQTFEKVPPKEAVKRLMVERIGKHPLDQLNALKSLLA